MIELQLSETKLVDHTQESFTMLVALTNVATRHSPAGHLSRVHCNTTKTGKEEESYPSHSFFLCENIFFKQKTTNPHKCMSNSTKRQIPTRIGGHRQAKGVDFSIKASDNKNLAKI